EIKLDIPPGLRTLVLIAYADPAGTMVIGSGCTQANLAPGAQVCVNLMLFAAPDQSVPDAAILDMRADLATCSGAGCLCTVSPDSCGPALFCNSGECQSGCKLNADCAGMTAAVDGGLAPAFCDAAHHRCVQCLASSDCPAGNICSPSGACTVGCD